MTGEMWATLIVGLFVGFFGGRWYAETFAARYDMRQRWERRKKYREDD